MHGVNAQVIKDTSQILHVKISHGLLAEDIFCTFVYAKCYRSPRRLLWEDLAHLYMANVPWLIGGDFNSILHTNKNQGGSLNILGPMEDFNGMVMECGLTDAGFEGELYIWTNRRIWKRLDRVLYSKEWMDFFNCTRVTHLPRRLSDHHPLLILASKNEGKHPSSFRFHSMWLRHQSFYDTVKSSWTLPIHGHGMCKLQQKLYRTKELLKSWNKEVFGNVFSRVEEAKTRASEADKCYHRNPSDNNLITLNKLNAEVIQTLNMESDFWRQKSNCKWLELGERNTKFFHSMVKKKRVKSRIHRILEEDEEITDPDQIKQSAADYFRNLLTTDSLSLPHPNFSFHFPQIPDSLASELCKTPSLAEIKDVVFNIHNDSVAGPNGFSSEFYQTC
ncbi:UNVERIFIED_CONTAM: LINE-1 reverse transcriptase [Sesamum latifolium]|uniref:LINE-1 reverse transcriptase n=1 Tax=Sesamum latifolium TaxID=2727402 RepID=A0AAW2YB29_9LAMI